MIIKKRNERLGFGILMVLMKRMQQKR